MSGLFVTGTDTGVGKTAVACALAAALAEAGRPVGVMKPFESGCALDARGELVPADALALMAAAGVDDALSQVCPYRFEPPVAPGVAAARAGVTVDPDRVRAAYAGLAARHDPMLVEGAGGLLVPATPELLVVDLAVRLDLPVLLVARAGLGTINHTLLSLEAARRRGLSVRAVVLNRADDPADASLRDNAEVIARWGEVEVLGPLPAVGGNASPGEVAADQRVRRALRRLVQDL